MLLDKPFYHSLIRKYIIAFGTLFNNIYIEREKDDKKHLFKVPLTFAKKDKQLARAKLDENLDKAFASQTLPIMSFEIKKMVYDGSRKLQTVNVIKTKSRTDSEDVDFIYVPVPYNFFFELNIWTKNEEDATKIIEQIFPFFTPDWTVTMELISDLNIKHDIPIILTDSQEFDVYEGPFPDRRILNWSFTFLLKGYLYGPKAKKAIIKFINTQLFSKVDLSARPESKTEIRPGLTANGEPTSNSSLSIPAADIKKEDNYGYIITIEEPVEFN